jgi:hypothetical protein
MVQCLGPASLSGIRVPLEVPFFTLTAQAPGLHGRTERTVTDATTDLRAFLLAWDAQQLLGGTATHQLFVTLLLERDASGIIQRTMVRHDPFSHDHLFIGPCSDNDWCAGDCLGLADVE